MQKWEYETIIINEHQLVSDIKSEINVAGQDGWKLVSVDNGVAYFRRPLHIIQLKQEDVPYPSGTYFDKEGHIALVID